MQSLLLTGRGIDSLKLSETAEPRPGPHELLLRMRYASLNYRDLAIAQGTYGNFARPLVLGSDGAGEVIAVGEAVRGFRVGQRVAPNDTPEWICGPPRAETLYPRLGGPLDGVFRESMCVPESAAVAVPDALSDAQAATLCGAGVTAWQALFELGQLLPGQRVLVQGTGSVSLFALQLAAAAGAGVFVSSRSADKLARARELGASELIDTRVHPDWAQEVLRRTGGRGVDLVLDVLGGDQLRRSVAAARVGGRVILIGFLDGVQASLPLPEVIARSVSLHATSGRSRASFEAFVAALAQARVQPVIDRVLPLAQAREAFEYLQRGSAFGKIVLKT